MRKRIAEAHKKASQGASSEVQQRLDDCFLIAKLCTSAVFMIVDTPSLLKHMKTLVNLEMGYPYVAEDMVGGAIIQEPADVFSAV